VLGRPVKRIAVWTAAKHSIKILFLSDVTLGLTITPNANCQPLLPYP
jgi:hypothetical protein